MNKKYSGSELIIASEDINQERSLKHLLAPNGYMSSNTVNYFCD